MRLALRPVCGMSNLLASQAYAGNVLDRSADLALRKAPRFLVDTLNSPAGAEFTLVQGAAVLTLQVPEGQPASLSWLNEQQLEEAAAFVRHGGVFAAGGGMLLCCQTRVIRPTEPAVSHVQAAACRRDIQPAEPLSAGTHQRWRVALGAEHL